MVEHLARRHGQDPATARGRALDTLRLVAASREAAAAQPGEPEPELDRARRTQILRAARARLWLDEEFETRHRPQDIPEDHPALEAARHDIRIVHSGPTVETCQLIVRPPVPKLAADPKAGVSINDPHWRARAHAIMEDLERRMTQIVPKGDAKACAFIRALTRFEDLERPDHEIRFEMQGFELGKCAQENSDGTCKTHALDQDWEMQVGSASAPGFIPSFSTQFGLHLVYLLARHEPVPPESPEAEQKARASVHMKWQREAYMEVMDRLRRERTVRVAANAGRLSQL